MLIIAHRGHHKNNRSLENKKQAILSADVNGWASEIDLRMNKHHIVMSHDPLIKDGRYDSFWSFWPINTPLFLHIKESEVADSLSFSLTEDLYSFYVPIKGTCFLYTVSSLDEILSHQCQDCWVEQPNFEWISRAPNQLEGAHNLFVVSPELHGYELTDDVIISYKSKKWIAGICTDYPERWL